MEDDIVVGFPSAMFMPLGRYKLKNLTGLASTTVPIRGSYPESSGLTGTYDICPESGAILFGVLTQVMLALGKYPTLADNQRFVIAGLELDGDLMTVIGRVVELMGVVNAEAAE